MRRATLRLRLFLSYAAVAVVGGGVLVTVVEVLAPRLFDHRLAGMGNGTGRGAGLVALHQAFTSALARSVVAALGASVVAGAVAATVVAHRLLRPLDEVRAATGRIAAGHYDEPVAVPPEPELAALAADVNRLADTLAATERRRRALIGDVAHEMRTPLTTARGYIEGLADGLFETDEALAVVGDELRRLERLASDLAAVSRAEEGRLDLAVTDADLAEVAALVAARLGPQFSAAGVSLSVEGGPAPVRGDPDRLAQAVTNLVGNALAYTPAGGVVRVATRLEGGQAVLRVTDTGAGLEPAQLERVFERFYRAQPEGRAGGTGIGLTITRAVARAHGGDVTAASPGPGRGSVFTLSLPAR